MDAFAALGDPTRRHVVELLARRGEMTAGELADHFDSARPTVSRHVRILREAGFVRVRAVGREQRYALELKALERIERWIERNRQLCSERFALLERHVEGRS